MNASVAQALAAASEHHRGGRLAEAEAGYRDVLKRMPGHPDALHRLGILARHAGRHATALEFFEKAIASNPREPIYHNDAGIALHALGRIDEALARFRNAVAVDPNHAGAQNNLANLLRARGELDEAVQIYRRAVELHDQSPELWYNLGNALGDQRAFVDAEAAYRKALALRSEFDAAQVALGNALVALGRLDEALAWYARALATRETAPTIARFVDAFARAELRATDPIVRDAAQRALATPWARPSELAPACVRLLMADRTLAALAARAAAAWPRRLGHVDRFGDREAATLGSDRLLKALLESAPVCDLAVERLLTLARYALLDRLRAEAANDAMLPFACALARQCFVNGYVFSCSDDEAGRAAQLCGEISAALGGGGLPSALELAVVATYFPLHTLVDAERLLGTSWPVDVAALVEQQVREPLDELRLRARLPRLTPIEDAVSTSVREQYEEHPYPRWVKLPPATLANDDVVSGRALWTRRPRNAPLEILVAGCGTGQESIEFAQAFPRARVLAVDLSIASLAYAKRKADERGLVAIEHAQADLTKLGLLARRFDVISSVGVLHHLADPVEGLRVLAGLLAPGGDLLVGLYSERARADVVAARAFIAEHGYRPVGDDIRRCRQDLVANAPELAARLARRSDFFVTDECRDLLFHVQEHRFSLSRIRDVLGAANLAFDGFVLRADLAARYASRSPDDRTMTDLESWERFEAQEPDAFAGMYIFWARHGRAAAPRGDRRAGPTVSSP